MISSPTGLFSKSLVIVLCTTSIIDIESACGFVPSILNSDIIVSELEFQMHSLWTNTLGEDINSLMHPRYNLNRNATARMFLVLNNVYIVFTQPLRSGSIWH